jgi:hypothetical protein
MLAGLLILPLLELGGVGRGKETLLLEFDDVSDGFAFGGS